MPDPVKQASFVGNAEQGFAIEGDLDRFTVPALWQDKDKLWQGASVRLSLAGVGHTDTAGLALLVMLQAEARHHGVHFSLTGLPRQLQAVARVSNLDGLLSLRELEPA